MTDGMPNIIDNIVPKVVAKDIEINPSTTEWMIDPIQSYTLQLKRQKLPIFAEALNRNLTGLYFQFLQYKVKLRENISIECKGVTRCISGDTMIKISRRNRIFDDNVEHLDKRFKVFSFNFKKSMVEIADAEKFDSGKQSTYVIKTKSGKTVCSTANHRFFLIKNGKILIEALRNIKVGDKFVTIRK